MSSTRIAIHADEPRTRVDLVAGAIVPRLIERGPRSARIALVAGGALLLGGDRVDIAVTVGSGCTLDLEDIGGTVAYASDGVAAFWDVEVTLGADSRLRWAGLPLVIADSADVHRQTRIRLGDGAIAVIRESVVLGRSGERGGRIRHRTSVADAEGPVLEEELDADGGAPVPGVLGANRVLDTIIRVGDRPPAATGRGATFMALSAPGAIARYLGDAAHASPLAEIWNEWADLPLAVERNAVDVTG
ncbi:urease accessory protein UreD [Microbacterium sp. A8/3-1]|uniref:Urease accessory protein UreD n=1 Tax=Microbacterium sp. A8/3-1 TaxID=3160749 RepID=A0AAU7VT92_9MICO